MSSYKTAVQWIEITNEQAGRRLDHFLFARFKDIPKSYFYRLLRSGNIRVNKKRVLPSYRIQAGDQLRLPPMTIETGSTTVYFPSNLTRKIKDRILYESDRIIVLNKPVGLAVHRGSGIDFGLIDVLRRLYTDHPSLELVHRLDRETSGCIVVAKQNDILRELHRLFLQGKVLKRYLVLTMGHFPKAMHRVDVPLAKNVLQSGERMVRVDAAGKRAITEFRVVEYFNEASLVEATLKTGRTHQIRVHARHTGHPIAGDKKYGDRLFNDKMHRQGLHRLFLHAHQIHFIVPSTGECIDVTAPLDKELTDFLVALRSK